MVEKFDKIDVMVLKALMENGRATVREIAREINLPITTVHNRLNKLKKNKTIRKFTIEPDYEALDRGILVFISLGIDHSKLIEGGKGIEALKKQLHGLPEVEKIYAVTGGIDIIIMARVGSIKELDEFLLRKLRSIRAIKNTTSQIVLEEG